MPTGLKGQSWWWTLVGNYNRERKRERKGAKIFLMDEISLKHGIYLHSSYVCVYVNRKWIDKEFWFSSVQSLSCVRLFATPWIAARQASLSITNYRNLLKLMPIESVMPSSHLILCRSLLLLPLVPPRIRVFSNESTLRMRWPKYWSFSFSISSSNEHPGLISCTMGWLDLLAVQGTLKSLLHYHNSKASILQLLAFFMVQLSHPYMTIGKTIALTIWTFVSKMMSLIFNMLSQFVLAFLPRSKQSFNFLDAVTIHSDFSAQENKNLLLFPLFPLLFALKWWDQDAMIFVFWMWSFKPDFLLFSFTLIKRFFSSSSFSTIRIIAELPVQL